MPSPAFPTLEGDTRPDTSQYERSKEDPSMSQEMEGGYTYTRARHTRAPRFSWKIGYRQLTDAERDQLEDFWDEVRGGSVIFDWLNHEDGSTYSVRFKGELRFKYVGVGTFRRWDCSFELQQA